MVGISYGLSEILWVVLRGFTPEMFEDSMQASGLLCFPMSIALDDDG